MVNPNNMAAFPMQPCYTPDGEMISTGQIGMTLRDFAAIEAMKGLASGLDRDRLFDADSIGTSSLCLADALLKRLKEPPCQPSE